MSKKKKPDSTSHQLTIPYSELIKKTSIPINYDFENMKKYFLPKHPILEFPLFLPMGSEQVNKSRLRNKELFEQKKEYREAITVNQEDLFYISDCFVIKSDQDYGLPDEFDGLVYDCISMMVSKEYSAKDKTYIGYQIDENVIMKELINNGYKRNGKLYNRIKQSIDRLYNTSYELYYIDEKSKTKQSHKIRLINEVHRKGSINSDERIEQTIIIPNAAILKAIEDKKYHILDNQSRYKLPRYISKTILEKFYKVIKAQIYSSSKDMYLAIKENNYPFLVISYQNFCKNFAITPRKGADFKPTKIKTQLETYLYSLEEQNIAKLIGIEANKTSEDKDYNLIFIFYQELIDYIFENTNRNIDGFKLKDISDQERGLYYGKMEKQVKQRKHKDMITKKVALEPLKKKKVKK